MVLDVISTVPYDVVDIIVRNNSTSSGDSATSQLKVLRVLKIMKLFKLLRIFKSARIFATVQNELGLSNSNSSLISFLATFLIVIHWIACVWGLAPQFEERSWYEAWGHKDPGDPSKAALSVADEYALCLYASVQMMVMGEAEPTKAHNTLEYAVAVVAMILGGSVYAYVIGSVCSIISVRDPAKQVGTAASITSYLHSSHFHSVTPLPRSRLLTRSSRTCAT
jgi:potassium voltage-gated channel Eag-related subfamily H protein 7